MKNKEKYDYFEEFIKLTDYILKSTEILSDVVENFDRKKLDENIKEVHTLENAADDIIHKMRKHLIKDFLPPIDREDIILIGHKLDNIEDGIDEILINIKILNVSEMKKDIIKQIRILIVCAEAVKEAFLEFKNFKNIELINKKVIDISNWEEEGDRIFEKLMSDLYKNEKDAIELSRWTSIYNCLENTIDSCEEVGDCIADIAMKNS